MNNKLFFTLTIMGTFLMIALLFSQNQTVDAEELKQTATSDSMYQSALNQLQSMLSTSDSEIAQANLESKIQAMEYKQNVQAIAINEPQKSLEEVCRSIQMEETSLNKQLLDEKPGGIFEVQEDVLGEEGYLINTLWRGNYNGYEVEVYAGSLLDDTQKGLVILHIPGLELFKVILDPQPQGALRIQQVEGYRLQLTSTSAANLYFDLPAQQFVQDLSKSLAVVDLPPAPTPIADPCAQFNTP